MQENKPRRAITFVATAFSIALGLLYVLVLRGIAVQIAPPPKVMSEPYPDVSSQEKCAQEGGRWIQSQKQLTNGTTPGPDKIESYCQGPLRFERQREQASEKNQQISLFVFAIGGGVVIALCLLIPVLHPIAPGLMLGGIVAFFISGVHIWMLSPGLGRLITIIIIFLVLVVIGLYVFREKDKTVGST